MENTAELYLDLLEKVVTNLVYEDAPIPNEWFPEREFRPENRETGTDWPSVAHTMVGLRRIRNIRTLLDRVVADGVPGDFIETGVWRGGVCIFARGYLKAHGITDRNVWLADSFEGIPDTGEDGHPMDREMALHRCNGVLGVTADTVRENFGRYGLLDDQVRFLPGWFKDTLPTAPVERLAVLRLDGDLYESTMDALVALYPKLAPGGYCIVDDYGDFAACEAAVHEYRAAHGSDEPLTRLEGAGAWWRKAR